MRGAWHALVRLCARRESALSLALFRMAVGTVVCIAMGLAVGHGAVEAIWVDAAHGGIFPSHHHWLIDLLGGARPTVIWGLVWCTLAAGACTALGLGGRLAPLVALHGHGALYATSVAASSDLLLGNALWLLVLAHANASWSLDSLLRHGRFRRPEVRIGAWPRYLAIFQLINVYSYTGFQKLGANWGHSGGYSALYYVLQRPNWQRMDMSFVAHVYPLTQVMTFVTVYWEMCAPLLLLFYYYRYTPQRGGMLRGFCLRHDPRLWFLLVGSGVHIGIALAMEVGVFSYITMSFYLCCVHPDEWALWARRVSRRFARA